MRREEGAYWLTFKLDSLLKKEKDRWVGRRKEGQRGKGGKTKTKGHKSRGERWSVFMVNVWKWERWENPDESRCRGIGRWTMMPKKQRDDWWCASLWNVTHISKTVLSCSSLDFFSSISQSLCWPSSTSSRRAMSRTSCKHSDLNTLLESHRWSLDPEQTPTLFRLIVIEHRGVTQTRSN